MSALSSSHGDRAVVGAQRISRESLPALPDAAVVRHDGPRSGSVPVPRAVEADRTQEPFAPVPRHLLRLRPPWAAPAVQSIAEEDSFSLIHSDVHSTPIPSAGGRVSVLETGRDDLVGRLPALWTPQLGRRGVLPPFPRARGGGQWPRRASEAVGTGLAAACTAGLATSPHAVGDRRASDPGGIARGRALSGSPATPLSVEVRAAAARMRVLRGLRLEYTRLAELQHELRHDESGDDIAASSGASPADPGAAGTSRSASASAAPAHADSRDLSPVSPAARDGIRCLSRWVVGPTGQSPETVRELRREYEGPLSAERREAFFDWLETAVHGPGNTWSTAHDAGDARTDVELRLCNNRGRLDLLETLMRFAQKRLPFLHVEMHATGSQHVTSDLDCTVKATCDFSIPIPDPDTGDGRDPDPDRHARGIREAQAVQACLLLARHMRRLPGIRDRVALPGLALGPECQIVVDTTRWFAVWTGGDGDVRADVRADDIADATLECAPVEPCDIIVLQPPLLDKPLAASLDASIFVGGEFARRGEWLLREASLPQLIDRCVQTAAAQHNMQRHIDTPTAHVLDEETQHHIAALARGDARILSVAQSQMRWQHELFVACGCGDECGGEGEIPYLNALHAAAAVAARRDRLCDRLLPPDFPNIEGPLDLDEAAVDRVRAQQRAMLEALPEHEALKLGLWTTVARYVQNQALMKTDGSSYCSAGAVRTILADQARAASPTRAPVSAPLGARLAAVEGFADAHGADAPLEDLAQMVIEQAGEVFRILGPAGGDAMAEGAARADEADEAGSASGPRLEERSSIARLIDASKYMARQTSYLRAYTRRIPDDILPADIRETLDLLESTAQALLAARSRASQSFGVSIENVIDMPVTISLAVHDEDTVHCYAMSEMRKALVEAASPGEDGAVRQERDDLLRADLLRAVEYAQSLLTDDAAHERDDPAWPHSTDSARRIAGAGDTLRDIVLREVGHLHAFANALEAVETARQMIALTDDGSAARQSKICQLIVARTRVLGPFWDELSPLVALTLT